MAFVALALAGCQGNGGAVSVRWRIVDQSTGEQYDPGDYKANDGSCCACVGSDGKCETKYDPTTHVPDCANPWQIENVSVTLANANTGAPIPDGLSAFPCSIREKTTPFVLPPGTFAISLAVTNDVGDGMNVPAPVAVPPPSIRTIVAGDVVNLDVIEIAVDLPLPQ
jgi:hypothetical protein